ncbi:hypothetical protein K8T06_04795 [bacterium]|nr:hypothetical protein [bacterium]
MSKILRQLLTEQGKYEEALQKHFWYHQNALELDPSQKGVRLSHALTGWARLGKKYPKALAELKEVRDEKVKQIRSGFCRMDSFLEVEAINRVLDENEKTIALFKHIDKFEPVLAKE